MALPGNMRNLGTTLLAVVFLALAVVVMCVTGPMMALANPCETLQTAAVPCSSSSAAHQSVDQVAHVVPMAVDVVAIGLPEPVDWHVQSGPTALLAQPNFISIPLRA